MFSVALRFTVGKDYMITNCYKHKFSEHPNTVTNSTVRRVVAAKQGRIVFPNRS